MESAKLHGQIIGHYAEHHEHEWKRLSKGKAILEFITTVHYLERYLPGRGTILDLGSGPGKYAVWLADRGYDVVAVDPVEVNIRSLTYRMRALGLSKHLKKAYIGYAQNLDFIESKTFDAVVCLGGPFSHIMSLHERKTAASEILRVAKRKAKIFISVMGRLDSFGGTVRDYQRDLDSSFIDKWVDTGDYPGGYGFTPFHGFRPDELEKLFGRRIHLAAKTALEGYTAFTTEEEISRLKRNKDRWNKFLKIHLSICEEPETIGVSEHYMIVGTKP